MAMLAAEGGPWGAAAGGPAAKGPGLGHLLHMPSHTFVRIGRYHDAVAANVHAWRADVADASACQSPYEPEHNTDMLVYAANMGGEVMRLQPCQCLSGASLKRADLLHTCSRMAVMPPVAEISQRKVLLCTVRFASMRGRVQCHFRQSHVLGHACRLITW